MLSAAKHPRRPHPPIGPPGCFAAAQHDTRGSVSYGIPECGFLHSQIVPKFTEFCTLADRLITDADRQCQICYL